MTRFERVAALVLAAGESRRFGSDKLLHELDGVPLAAYVASSLKALPFGWRLAVTTPSRAPLFDGYEILDNPNPSRGMGSSLAIGAWRAMALGAEAMLVCLADMPFVSRAHLMALVDAKADVVATVADGVRSPPVLFAARYFAELTSLTGDHGARHLLRDAIAVEAPAQMVRDFDEPADFS